MPMRMRWFAASELRGYLERLFGVNASIADSASDAAEYLVLLGNPQTNPFVAEAVGEAGLPQLMKEKAEKLRAEAEWSGWRRMRGPA